MTALITTWLLLSLSPVVTVEGDAVCPTAADVATRLGALLPARQTEEPPDVARLEVRGGALLVTLARPDGSPIGERTLDRNFPCADLASAAAVVVATWESDVHPEFRLASPPEPPPPALPPPPRPAPPVVTAAPPPRRAAATWDLGAAVSSSFAPGPGGASPALGALVVGSLMSGERRLGGRLALAGALERELPLGTGLVRWQRVAAALGPQVRLALAGPWMMDVHAEGVAGWLVATGQGFDKDLSDGSLDPGVGAGLRLLQGGGGLEPWLDVSATSWLRRQTAYSTPDGASVALPRFEAMVAIGLSYGSRP